MADNRVKSFYLPPDVLEFLAGEDNASAVVTRLVRREALRKAEAGAYEQEHGTPLTDRTRQAARAWAREQLATAATRAAAHADETDELRRRMGWTE